MEVFRGRVHFFPFSTQSTYFSIRARASFKVQQENDPFFQAAIERASLRFRESQSPDPLLIDPYVACLLPCNSLEDMDQQLHPYCLATKFIDDKLLETMQSTDGLKQVVLLTDGLDTRPYRLNWPKSTLVFDICPDKVFRGALQKLQDAGAKIPRGCMSFHVPSESFDVENTLCSKGFSGTRPSIWAFQLMILVDDAGKAFPSINHSPWFGVTLADFVMPFFLFIVGVSASLVFKKVSCKPQATKKVLLRTVKLFILGVVLQGGYFHGRNNLSYGVDIAKIRWMGVLQRISIGYLFASILEIWFANDYPVDSSKAFIRRYFFQALAGMLIGLSYLILVYGLYVPDWFFEISSLNMESRSPVSGYRLSTQTVNCGVRGSLEPPCNVVGLIDRLLLGEKHLYQRPVYRRTKECSVNSPDYGPPPSNAPGWCLAPFDPEGILSSLMATVTCLVGLHFGHIFVHVKDHRQRVIFWSVFSVFLTLAGYVLELAGVPLSKPLYTLSYMFITAGVSGLLLVVLYYIVDVKCFQKPMILFQWMGMNALILYAMAACDLFSGAVQGFYWYSPENNLVDITERFIQAAFNSKKWGTLVFVMLEILIWGLVAGFLHAKKVYIKL